MATKFNLTAQLNVLPPNARNIVNQLNNQLRGVQANVNVNVTPQTNRNLRTLNNQLRDVDRNASSAASSATALGVSAAQAAKRFGGFSIVTATLFNLTRAIKDSLGAAIEFEKELNKIRQVTGNSVRDLSGLTGEIDRLATGLGVSSERLLQASRILSQTGLSAREVEQSLSALAKTDLAPTFSDIIKTTEGSIAIFRQFGLQANELEAALGSINAVSGRFAVESDDIIAAVRRTGGAFAAAGGNLNELIALFTSVRATTRESAESIATGFRTIFTRLQRSRTIAFLDDLGIKLRDVEGQFVGPFEAINRLSSALSQLEGTDPRFAQITEELGGFRQVSKVIPLVQQFATAQQALAVAQQGTASLSLDAAKAQDTLANQIQKTREEFAALIRNISQDSSFKAFVGILLKTADAFIKVADSIRPLLPLIATLGTIGLAKGTVGFARGFANEIGRPSKFAAGGIVPGSGNQDTVPALLTPGEFVIRKKAVQEIGASNLANVNKFAGGGLVPEKFGIVGLAPLDKKVTQPSRISPQEVLEALDRRSAKSALLGSTRTKDRAKQQIRKSIFGDKASAQFTLFGEAFDNADADTFAQKTTESAMLSVMGAVGSNISGFTGAQFKDPNPSILNNLGLDSIIGEVFEGALTTLGAPFDIKTGIQDAFDFPQGLGEGLSKALPSLKGNFPIDAKRTISTEAIRGVLDKKIPNYLADIAESKFIKESLNPQDIAKAREKLKSGKNLKSESGLANRLGISTRGNIAAQIQQLNDLEAQRLQAFAAGGSAGTDTVPALLTPGEFVLNKRAVQKIGIGTAEKLNNVDKFADGGLVGGGKGTNLLLAGSIVLPTLLSQFDSLGTEVQQVTQNLVGFGAQAATLVTVLRNIPNRDVTKLEGLRNQAVATRERINTQRGVISGLEQSRFSTSQDIFNFQRNNPNQQVPAKLTRRLQRQNAELNKLNFERDTERKKLAEQRLESRRATRNLDRFNKALIGVGVAAAVINTSGQFLQNRGRSALEAGTGGTGQFVTGGALSGAGTGLVAGASIGTLIAPGVGTAVGAAVGAVGGAAVGLATSLQEANAILERGNFNRELEKFTTALSNANQNLATTFSSAAAVNQGVLSLQNRIAVTSGDDRETAQGALRNSLVPLDEFLRKSAAAAGTIEIFEQQNKEAIKFLSIWTDTPIEETSKRFADLVNNQKKLQDATTAYTLAQQKLTREIEAITDFTAALNNAAEASKSFDTTINGLIAGLSGQVGVTARDRSEFIGELGVNPSRFDAIISDIGGVFGDGGTEIASTLSEVNRVASLLPDVLRDVVAIDPLAENISKNINDALKGSDISDEVRRRILRFIDRNVIGDEGKEQAFIQAIQDDAVGLTKNIVGAFNPLSEVFAKGEQLLTERINVFIDASGKYAEAIANGADRIDSVLNIQLERAQFLSGVTGRAVSDNTLNSISANRQSAFTGGLTVAGATTQLQNSNQALIDFNKQLEEGKKNYQELLPEIQAQQINNAQARKALQFFADVTKRTAEDQIRLRRLQADADARRGFAQQAVFGDISSRQQLGQNIGLTAAAIQGGITNIPQELRGGIQQLLQSLPASFENVLGSGSTAGDLLNQFTSQGLQELGFNQQDADRIAEGMSTPLEQQTQAINAKYQEGINAQLALNDLFDRQISDLGTNINQSLREFSDKLNRSIITAEGARLNNEQLALQREGTSIIQQLESLRGAGLQNLNLEDLSVVRNNLPLLLERTRASSRIRQAELAQNTDFNFQQLGLSTGIENANSFSTTVLGALGINPSDVVNFALDPQDAELLFGLSGTDALSQLSSNNNTKTLARVLPSLIEQALNASNITDTGLRQQIFTEIFKNAGDSVSGGRGVNLGTLENIIIDAITNVGSQNVTSLNEQIRGADTAVAAFNQLNIPIPKTVEELEKLTNTLQSIPLGETFASLTDKSNSLETSIQNLKGAIDGLRLNTIPQGNNSNFPLLASGGVIRGPGGPREDRIPVMVSNGEAVLTANAVNRLGTKFIRDANNGRINFANQGLLSLINQSNARREQERREREINEFLQSRERRQFASQGRGNIAALESRLSRSNFQDALARSDAAIDRFNNPVQPSITPTRVNRSGQFGGVPRANLSNINTPAQQAALRNLNNPAAGDTIRLQQQAALRDLNNPAAGDTARQQRAVVPSAPQNAVAQNTAGQTTSSGGPPTGADVVGRNFSRDFEKLDKIVEGLSRLNGLKLEIEGKVDVNVTFANAQFTDKVQEGFNNAFTDFIENKLETEVDRILRERPGG